MKTCPRCGAPQADILPTCDLCGSLFPGEKLPKPRFDITGLIGLISGILAIAGTVVFFYLIEYEDSDNPTEIMRLLIAALISMFFAATGPIAGFILSIAGLKKTRDKGVKGRGFAIAGIVVDSIMLLVAAFFIILIVVFAVYVFDTV